MLFRSLVMSLFHLQALLSVGYVVGGTLAEYAGLQWPFFTAVLLNLVIFIELMLAKDPETESTDQSSMKCGVALLKDPEILTGLGQHPVTSWDSPIRLNKLIYLVWVLVKLVVCLTALRVKLTIWFAYAPAESA